MRVIILAAGKSFHLDGINKILMKDPLTNKSLMTIFSEVFDGQDVSVVVGYKAIEVIQEYPDFDYVYNPNWAVTANSYSLSLALTEEPCYVISGDLIIERALIEAMELVSGNCILTEFTENRRLTSLNCSLDNGTISEIYQGPLRNINHPEAHGILK
jgi:choline kinase